MPAFLEQQKATTHHHVMLSASISKVILSVCSLRLAMGKRLGQAAALHGPLWGMWRRHLLNSSPCWLYVAVTLTHILCCRISEVLALRKEDFDFRNKQVKIAALKRGPEDSMLGKSAK
jgi:hypothetical protein